MEVYPYIPQMYIQQNCRGAHMFERLTGTFFSHSCMIYLAPSFGENSVKRVISCLLVLTVSVIQSLATCWVYQGNGSLSIRPTDAQSSKSIVVPTFERLTGTFSVTHVRSTWPLQSVRIHWKKQPKELLLVCLCQLVNCISYSKFSSMLIISRVWKSFVNINQNKCKHTTACCACVYMYTSLLNQISVWTD